MSQARDSGVPINAIEKHREDLEQLAESDLPVSNYADRTLELLDTEDEE